MKLLSSWLWGRTVLVRKVFFYPCPWWGGWSRGSLRSFPTWVILGVCGSSLSNCFGAIRFVLLLSPQCEWLWGLPVPCLCSWNLWLQWSLCRGLDSLLLESQAQWHMKPSMGSRWKRESFWFLWIAGNCCCLWLWQIQFSCNGGVLQRKNRRRANRGNSKIGRWNYTSCIEVTSQILP